MSHKHLSLNDAMQVAKDADPTLMLVIRAPAYSVAVGHHFGVDAVYVEGRYFVIQMCGYKKEDVH